MWPIYYYYKYLQPSLPLWRLLTTDCQLLRPVVTQAVYKSVAVVQATADEGLEQAKAAVVLNFRDRRIDRKNVKCRKKILIDRRTRSQLSLPADHPKYR